MAKVNVVITNSTETKTISVGPNKVVAIMDATPDKISGSGKMALVGCSNGNQLTDTVHEGNEVYANVNIGWYITPKPAKK